MKAVIRPALADGYVPVPGSKSIAHRYLICAALCNGQTVIDHCPQNEDIAATVDCLSAMGASFAFAGDTVTVTGIPRDTRKAVETRVFPCRESGSTLRFMLPLALTDGIQTHMTGSSRLLDRPLSVYEEICRGQDIEWHKDTDGITVSGHLTAGAFSVPGNISSQFITGLLLSLPRLAQDSRLSLTGTVESRPYIDLTLDTLRTFGITVSETEANQFDIPGAQTFLSPGLVSVPPDESSLAFFGALQALGGHITLPKPPLPNRQGDRVWRDLFPLCAVGTPTVSVKDCPDLAPILCVVGALCHGITLTDTARLRFKESDRGQAIADELAKCGVTVTVSEHQITVSGGQVRPPHIPLDSHNDHRVAMSLAVLCTVTGGTVCDAEAVAKSLPGFWSMMTALGIPVDLIE